MTSYKMVSEVFTLQWPNFSTAAIRRHIHWVIYSIVKTLCYIEK